MVPQRDRHRPRRLLAVVVGANDHLLRPLRCPLGQLFLRLLQVSALIDWRLVILRNLGFVVSFALILVLSTTASVWAAEFGTAEEAKAMLEKAVAAVKKDKGEALRYVQ